MNNTDVFICYRRYSAQTAKLFKRYLEQHHFSGDVWYSDSEICGNYKSDIPSLINSAKCTVVFIDPKFTFNFLNDEVHEECITAIEIVAIIKRKLQDDSFRIIPVYVDREPHLSEKESEIIRLLLSKAETDNPEESVKLISQSNADHFMTSRDYEDNLFSSLSRKMLPNEYYKSRMPRGNYAFGLRKTSIDVVLWDSDKNIDAQNISFEVDTLDSPLYTKIEHRKSNMEYESQNNKMISLVGIKVVLSDDTEEKELFIRYKEIEYRLFHKTLTMWDAFELDKEIAMFDWHSDLYLIPNAMGLAFMVLTSDNRMIFTRRSKKRHVRSGEYDCSIVEGLKPFGTRLNGT